MYLLFDIGGSKIRAAVSNDEKTLAPNPKIIDTPQKYEEMLGVVKNLSAELTEGEKINKVAMGIAGALNKEKDSLVSAPNLPDFIGKQLKNDLEKISNCSVVLENDASFAGLGEAVFGTGKDFPIVSYLTISTGVGGTRIVNRKIDLNSQGFEPGHQIIEANGKICEGCKIRGHLEAYISGPSIEKKYGQKPEEITDPRVWDEIAKYLSIGLNNVIVLWSPDVVVLGGSVMKSLPLGPVEFYLKQSVRIFPKIPKVILSNLSDLSGIYGALAFLQQA